MVVTRNLWRRAGHAAINGLGAPGAVQPTRSEARIDRPTKPAGPHSPVRRGHIQVRPAGTADRATTQVPHGHTAGLSASEATPQGRGRILPAAASGQQAGRPTAIAASAEVEGAAANPQAVPAAATALAALQEGSLAERAAARRTTNASFYSACSKPQSMSIDGSLLTAPHVATSSPQPDGLPNDRGSLSVDAKAPFASPLAPSKDSEGRRAKALPPWQNRDVRLPAASRVADPAMHTEHAPALEQLPSSSAFLAGDTAVRVLTSSLDFHIPKSTMGFCFTAKSGQTKL